MFALKRMLYEASPSCAQRLIGQIPFSVLAGASYRKALQRTRQVEIASADDLRRHQRQLLKEILEWACNTVPAYMPYRRYVEKLSPEEALKAFPLLDKNTLRDNVDQYVSTAVTRTSYWKSTTGGTSGEQLTFVLDNDAQNRELAFIHRLWARLGYKPSCRKATFRGIALGVLPENTYWRPNPIYNEYQFSVFHLNDSTLPAYLAKIQEYRPQFLHGYPSAVALLTGYCLRRGICLRNLALRGVLLGSEAPLPHQASEIDQVFGARVLSWYGHSERLILGGECEHDRSYHHFPDYGFLEVVDENGNRCRPGETGELVGTGFWNRSMPLIRYRTDDKARLLTRECQCGRAFERFDQVEGRWSHEYIIGKRHSRISLAALNMHGPFFANVIRYQYHQTRPGILTLKLMVTGLFGDGDIRALREAYWERVGDELEVHFEVVADIPLTTRGKLRRLVQCIPPADPRNPRPSVHTEALD